MMKNTWIRTLVFGMAALAGTLACSGGGNTPPTAPLNCEKGTHQEGDKCVLNGPISAPPPTAAPQK